jgi:TRAP-type C4-dicarboxylate transport system permease small subunit
MMPLLSFFADPPAGCAHSFLGLIPWYQYLPLHPAPDCTLNLDLTSYSNWNQLWLVAMAVVDDLLRLAGLIAVAIVIWGGIKLMTSSGNPQNVKQARETLLNAAIGIAIAAIAINVVNYLGNQLGSTAGSSNGLPMIATNANLVTDILNIVFGIIGAICVIMVVLGGYKYVLSRGEPQQTASAKNTILFALIGMTVSTIAVALTTFIASKV